MHRHPKNRPLRFGLDEGGCGLGGIRRVLMRDVRVLQIDQRLQRHALQIRGLQLPVHLVELEPDFRFILEVRAVERKHHVLRAGRQSDAGGDDPVMTFDLDLLVAQLEPDG